MVFMMPQATRGIHRDSPDRCYNSRVVMTDRRRAAVRALLVLVAGALVLLFAPLDVAAIRLGPLSLLWWYAVVAVPIGGAAIAFVALVVDTT